MARGVEYGVVFEHMQSGRNLISTVFVLTDKGWMNPKQKKRSQTEASEPLPQSRLLGNALPDIIANLDDNVNRPSYQLADKEIINNIDTSKFKDEKFIFDKGWNKRTDFKEFAKKLGNELKEAGNFGNLYVAQSEKSEATYIYLYKNNEDGSPSIKIRIATHATLHYSSI